MKEKRARVWLFALILVAAVAALATAYRTLMPKPVSGGKEITVTVAVPGVGDDVFVYQTDAAYLGEVLREEELIQGTPGPHGLYITSVGGVSADESLQQWWCITRNGEAVNTGVDLTPIRDGEAYELTLTTGY